MTVLSRPNVFAKPGRWFKGAVHVHSSASDGQCSPGEVLAAYRRRGYDFVCFGDHWVVTAPADDQGVLVIPGCELHTWGKGPNGLTYDTHVMCVGIAEAPPRPDEPICDHLTGRDLWNLARARSEYCVLAHPWWSAVTPQLIKEDCAGLAAIEVYNHNAELWHGLGGGEYVWDMLLNGGHRVDALAVDDLHGDPSDDRFVAGHVMVRAEQRSAEAILAALKAGDFYSSTGPAIEEVRFGPDGALSVRTSPAVSVTFRTYRYYGQQFTAPADNPITELTWQLRPAEMRFVRMEVADAQGRRAWSNPFYFAQ